MKICTYTAIAAMGSTGSVKPVEPVVRVQGEVMAEDNFIPSEDHQIRMALRIIRDVNDHFAITNKGTRSAFSESDKEYLREALTVLGDLADKIK